MTITIKDLPQTTEYILLREQKQRKERIKTYIDATIDKYPGTKDRIAQFWKENQEEYNKLTNAHGLDTFSQFFNKYDGEQDLIDLIKPEVIKQIDELLTEKPGDSEIIKELKEIYNIKGHKDEMPTFLKASEGGVSYLIFLVDLIRDYYLKDAPAYISKKLTDNDIKISELDKDAWTDAKGELFINVYANLNNDKEESDLDETIDGINEATEAIKNLIIKARQKRDSNLKDDLDELKRKYGTLEAERDQLKTDKSNLIEAGKTATATIDKLTAERDQWKAKAEAKPATTTTSTGTSTTSTSTGTQTDPHPIPGTEEWKAVALFLTEPNYYKARQLFNDLYNKNWTPAQRAVIYKMLAADKENAHWARDQWPQRFIK